MTGAQVLAARADRKRADARSRRTQHVVYEAVRRGGAATRGDVQRITGLSRSTVADIVAALLSSGCLIEQRPPGPCVARGRPSAVLVAVERTGYVGAVDIGHAHVAVALADTAGDIVAERRFDLDVDRYPDAAFTAVTGLLNDCCSELGVAVGGLLAVAAGVPGPIGAATDAIRSSTILPGWTDVHPAQELGRRLGRPVLLGNDADLGARGELRFGAGRGLRDIIYVKASHGIGAGLVLDGRSYRGAGGIAGEIGHTRVPGAKGRCRCGARGCLETLASIDVVSAQLAAGTQDARAVLEQAGRALGMVLAGVCNCLNPQAVLLGGELGAAGPPVITGVRAALDEYAMPASARAVEVHPAQLGRRAELLGAVWLGLEQAKRPV
jgi:predicted NBD/HSP70 family sugar kinase